MITNFLDYVQKFLLGLMLALILGEGVYFIAYYYLNDCKHSNTIECLGDGK